MASNARHPARACGVVPAIALEVALKLNPNIIAYCFTLGRYLSRGMEEEELVCAERFHSLAPWNPIAAGYLAGMLTRT